MRNFLLITFSLMLASLPVLAEETKHPSIATRDCPISFSFQDSLFFLERFEEDIERLEDLSRWIEDEKVIPEMMVELQCWYVSIPEWMRDQIDNQFVVLMSKLKNLDSEREELLSSAVRSKILEVTNSVAEVETILVVEVEAIIANDSIEHQNQMEDSLIIQEVESHAQLPSIRDAERSRLMQ